MFAKMTLDRVWPSRFGGLCSAGLPLAPQKPAAAARATNASAGLTPTSLPVVAPINVNGLSVKVAKGEAATIVADAVLNNMDLLSNVIKCALESNAQAPTLASVAQAWNGQVCFWKQQIVQCIVSSPVALLHGWGAPPRNLLVGMPQPTISPVFDAFQALGEKFPDRITTREDVLTLLDLGVGVDGGGGLGRGAAVLALQLLRLRLLFGRREGSLVVVSIPIAVVAGHCHARGRAQLVDRQLLIGIILVLLRERH